MKKIYFDDESREFEEKETSYMHQAILEIRTKPQLLNSGGAQRNKEINTNNERKNYLLENECVI